MVSLKNDSDEIIENTIIIGSGPAAYSAALFLKEQKPLLFEGEYADGIGPGGQLTTTTHVDNYPGFPNGTMGPDLMDAMKNQALKNGTRIISSFVTSIRRKNGVFSVFAENKSYKSLSVVIGTGASAKRLHVPGSDEYWTNGISACAVCDGALFMDQECAIIGGGDTAMEESLFLSNICSKVYLIHRRNEFRARADKLAQVKSTKNMKILTPFVLKSVDGDESLTSIKLENTETNEEIDLKVTGLFFGIGHKPNTGFLKSDSGKIVVDLYDNGYLKTDKQMKTSIPGMFACGDVQDFVYRQAVTAASSGCVAAKSCNEYLNKIFSEKQK